MKILPLIISYHWGKYLSFRKLFAFNNNNLPLIETLPLIKLFTVNNNYLPLTKLFTVNNSYLPFRRIFTVIKLFAVNNSSLSLIRIFTINKIKIICH